MKHICQLLPVFTAGTLTTKKVLQFAYLSIRTILLVVQANVRAKIDNFVTFSVYFDNFKVGSEQNLSKDARKKMKKGPF